MYGTSTYFPRTFFPDQHAHIHTYVFLFEPMLSQVILLPNMHLLIISLLTSKLGLEVRADGRRTGSDLPHFPGSWKLRRRRNGAVNTWTLIQLLEIARPGGDTPISKN